MTDEEIRNLSDEELLVKIQHYHNIKHDRVLASESGIWIDENDNDKIEWNWEAEEISNRLSKEKYRRGL